MIFCELDVVTVWFDFAIMEFSDSDTAFWVIEFVFPCRCRFRGLYLVYFWGGSGNYQELEYVCYYGYCGVMVVILSNLDFCWRRRQVLMKILGKKFAFCGRNFNFVFELDYYLKMLLVFI